MISRIWLISLIVSIIVILSISREAESELLGHVCQNNNYNPNGNSSSYRANLNFLLSNLTNASRTEEFYNFTAGLNTSAPTYGLYMCRGDVTRELCHSCMENASREILESCPDQTVAIIWFDNCMLRYSNRSIISLLDRSTGLILRSLNNVAAGELARFNVELGKMMYEIASRAARNSGSGKKFAIQEGNYSSFGKLYTLAQCTPDLSTGDCEECLGEAIIEIPTCCQSKRGGRVLFPSCNIRFETYKFYTSADNPPSVGKRLSVAVIIAIVASIIVSIVLFVLASLFLKKRSKETYGVVADGADGDDDTVVFFLPISVLL